MNGMFTICKTESQKGADYCSQPIPKISDHEVLVQIKSTSISDTDLHLYDWDVWKNLIIPTEMSDFYL